MTHSQKYDLENRLIDFAAMIIALCGDLDSSKAKRHVAGQLLRSGTSPAANYAEAQAAESASDFLHKMKICLKELRESLVWIKILIRAEIAPVSIAAISNELNQLIAIFVASIKTASTRLREESETYCFDTLNGTKIR